MARTALTVNTFLADSTTGILDPGTQAIDQANGMNLALASGAMPAAPTAKNVLLKVNNSAAGTQITIIRAGVNPPANRSGLGDLSVSLATTVTRWIGPLSSSRFAQADGSINVDFNAGSTGTITAFLVPERANI